MAKQQMIYGFHGVTALLRHRADDVIHLYIDSKRQDSRMNRLLALIESLQLSCIGVDTARLDQMSKTKQHQGIVAIAKEPKAGRFSDFLSSLNREDHPIIMLLDSVTDPHNLGACFRVADAFGVSAIVVPRDKSVGLTETVVKTASGTTETVPFFMVTNLVRCIESLKEAGFWVFGTDLSEESQPVNQLDLRGAVAWVFGAEGSGIRTLTRQHCDHLAIIPMIGEVDSLNISVAAGVCLYETQRQREFLPKG